MRYTCKTFLIIRRLSIYIILFGQSNVSNFEIFALSFFNLSIIGNEIALLLSEYVITPKCIIQSINLVYV